MFDHQEKVAQKKQELKGVSSKETLKPNFSSSFTDNRIKSVAQRKLQHSIANDTSPIQMVDNRAKSNGLPTQLKTGIEQLSGYAMNDVRVHYNSAKPAQLQAHAYAQGTDIHLASGQEKHLAHEAWHVVQQKQGRVKPTAQLAAKTNINDDEGLEREADIMGAKALKIKESGQHLKQLKSKTSHSKIAQKVDWAWWATPATTAAGIVGAVSGAAVGALKGVKHGYEDEDGVLEGARKGLLTGGREGYQHPGAAIGGLVGGAAGNAAGLVGAAAGGVTGLAVGYHQTGSITKAAVSGAAGAAAGYIVPQAAGALLGSAVGGAIDPGQKTEIRHTTGFITLNGFGGYGPSNHKVGKKMVAKLAAEDPVQGSATGINWTWMQFIRAQHPRANVVRGHLLNHDLGGFGSPDNLYPISTLANQQHSAQVEQHVKQLLSDEIDRAYDDEKPRLVHYTVEVIENQAHNPNNATFRCTFFTEGEAVRRVNIHSQLGIDRGGFVGAHNNPLEGEEWDHGQRKGFEGDDESESLADYKENKNIRISKDPANTNLTERVNAVSHHGAGLRTEGQLNIIEILTHQYLSHWPNRLKQQILIELHLNVNNHFDKEIVKFARTTASYADNKNNALDYRELIVQILEEQLLKLKPLHPAYYPIDDALGDMNHAQGEINQYRNH